MKERRINLGLVAIVLALVIVLLVALTIWHQSKGIGSTISLSSALNKKQFKVEVREGKGLFEVKPFKFSEISGSNLIVYFKNEGRNKVSVNFYNPEGDSSAADSMTVMPGEEGKITFTPASNDETYMINIVDSTEPLPVVIGELLITNMGTLNVMEEK